MNGTIYNMTADLPTQSLTISIKVDRAGSLQIAIPREVVDSRNGADGKSGIEQPFAIFLDAENVDGIEYSSSDSKWVKALGIMDHPEKYRIVVIPIKENTETVELVGTFPL